MSIENRSNLSRARSNNLKKRWEEDPEWREKMIRLHTGRARTVETKSKVKEAMKRNLSSPEARDVYSTAHGGKRAEIAFLALRGALTDDIMTLLNLKNVQ